MDRKFTDRLGEKHYTTEGYEAEIVGSRGSNMWDVRLSDGTYIENLYYTQIMKGNIKNPNHRSVCGVGYIGQGVYKTKINKKGTPPAVSWRNMICRCYFKAGQKKQNITYIKVNVCDDWQCFQNFAKWHEENTIENWELDKDILFKGNKIYSPETCCFVPKEINNLFTLSERTRGNLPLGVSIRNSGYEAGIRIAGKDVYLGVYKTIEEAFQAYKVAKENEIKRLANKWRGKITEECYQALNNWTVLITD